MNFTTVYLRVYKLTYFLIILTDMTPSLTVRNMSLIEGSSIPGANYLNINVIKMLKISK